MRSLGLVEVTLAGLLMIGACATHQSPLAQSNDELGGSAGGAGVGQGGAGQAGVGQGGAGQGGVGQGGDEQGGAGQGGDAAGTSGAAGKGNEPVIVNEPDGPSEFRWMNGLTDFPSVRLCWLPWEGNASTNVDVQPSPEILYGDLSKPALPAGFDAEKQSFRLHVLAGDLTGIQGKGCLELIKEPPPGVRVVPLPVLPPGTILAPRSRLAIAVGCLGGGAIPDSTSACGQGVDSALGNAQMLLVELSRIASPPGQFRLQVVHASTALPQISLQFMAAGIGNTNTIVSSLPLGKIAPRPPFSKSIEDLFGTNVTGARLVAIDATNGVSLIDTDVGKVLTESGLSPGAIAVDRGGVLVILGPRPGAPVDAAPVTPTRIRWLEAPSL